METTSGLLERTARRMVADLDPVAAVVLFGSRARGTEHAGSDWDVAVLLDREPDPSIRAAVPVPEHVNVLYKNRNDFRERALHIGSLESAIVRDGQILAGEWERPDQNGKPVVSNELVMEHLKSASSGVADAMHHACYVLRGENGSLKTVSHHTQSAAEFVSKTAMVHLGIDPKHVHDLVRLASQMEHEKPHDPRTAEWAATVRSMNGDSGGRNVALYRLKPLEALKRPFDIIGTVTEFYAVVLRDITETRDNFAPCAAEVAAAVRMRAENMPRFAGWASIPRTMRVRLDTWANEVQGISHLAQSRARRAARDTDDPDEGPGTSR